MPEKIISEYSIKKLFNYNVHQFTKNSIINLPDDLYTIKVDQQIKGRGKKGLIGLNYNVDEIKEFINKQPYDYFIVEKTINIISEHYFMIRFTNDHDEIYFGENIGGINFNDIHLCQKHICYGEYINFNHDIDIIGKQLYDFYKKYNFTFMEVNPLALTSVGFTCVDFAVKWDSDSEYLFNDDELQLLKFNNTKNETMLNDIEEQIETLDKKSGASMKFTLINKDANIWTLIAGGGASVMYTDNIVNLGYMNDLGNYGEYSGNPTENEVYQYTNLVLQQMLLSQTNKQMFLIVGGGISNFTMVDSTFKGIIKALKEQTTELQKRNVIMIVRRGGLNYKVGLDLFKNNCDKMNLKCFIYGPETHITKCLNYHLDKKEIVYDNVFEEYQDEELTFNDNIVIDGKIIILNLQTIVGQRILDYDYICGNEPSLVGFVHSGQSKSTNLFYGNKEISIPIFKTITKATECTKAQIALNYYSYRSAYSSSIECINDKFIKTILIVAEGMSMHQSRDLKLKSSNNKKTIFGPSSVGCLFAGGNRFGNAMGSIENIKELGLYNKGHIGLVTKSGGLLNEMANMINRVSDINCGIAVGGDRCPSTNILDVCMYYEKNDDIKLIILLGEIGGDQELMVATALKNGFITKPLIAWCTGISSTVSGIKQFGHAGAYTNNQFETALFKNYYLRKCGGIVPDTFEDIDQIIKNKCNELNLYKSNRQMVNDVPYDFSDLMKKNMLRVPSQFISSISNEKNDLLYNNKHLDHYLNSKCRIGNTIGNLLFKKDLPDYLCEFLEMTMTILADHGIAVSSAHNTAVCARSGQNISAAVASGLLCVHEKHGGALQDSAMTFFNGYYVEKLSASDLVKTIKVIPGIGHMYKNNTNNKDKRLEYLMEFIDGHFPNTDLIKYAKKVEKITLQKKENLILNVDGLVACAITNSLVHEYGLDDTLNILNLNGLNSIFIISRTIGLCGTFIDQNRLNQGLYRHPSWGIKYI